MFEKSKRCDNSGPNCVEVEIGDGVVRVRDSKLGEGSPVLSFTPEEWNTFCAGIKDGEFAAV